MASLIERLKQRMEGAGFAKEAAPTTERTRHIVRSNRWDERVWKEARKVESTDTLISDLEIGDEHRGGTRSPFDPSPELIEGLFQTFYKAAPEVRSRREVTREAYPAMKILQEVLENPKLQELQEYTAGDPVMASVALDSMADQLREIIGRLPPPPGPKGEKGEKGDPGGEPGGQAGQGSGQPGQAGQPGGQGGDPNDTSGGSDEGDDLEDLIDEDAESDFDPDSEDAMNQEEAEWEQEYDDLFDDLDLDRLVNKAMDTAEQEARELEGLRRGIGLEDGEWSSMSPEQRLLMAERLRTDEMKELAKVIGQMKRFALGVKATRINDVPHEAYDVETGNDLRRVLRPQLALLGTKETSYEFFRRYTEKELLQYKMRGTEEVGKGPIVIAIDKSGSMSGGPFNWAMGVAEALRRFAAEEDRDYYAMFFGNNNDRNRFDFPEGKGPFEKVLSFLSVDANGGTQFDGVLTEALERATKTFDQSDGKKGLSDIVFVTDGQAHLEEDWIKKFNQERERAGVRVFSVFIGGGYDMRYHEGPVGLLGRISDAVIPVTELTPQSVEEIFRKV